MVAQIANTTFTHLEDNFLLRTHPVIIDDSHQSWAELNRGSFLEYTSLLTQLMESTPCNVLTNLMSRPFLSINPLLELAMTTNNWFLHFRNCEFSAVKDSRAIIDRPYYLSPHLNTFYASWILVSSNYTMSEMKMLDLRGVILVLQLNGHTKMLLEPKQMCAGVCKSFEIMLAAGKALLFPSDFWNFSYKPMESTNPDEILSVTFVEEIEWFK